MYLRKIIQKYAGRDIYICMELSEDIRQENVIKRYVVYDYGKAGYITICSSQQQICGLEIPLDTEVLYYKEKRIMTDVEARYHDILYHIYIQDYIDIRMNSIWQQKISSQTTLASGWTADRHTTLGQTKNC